jgi:hypothetical protein
MTCSELVGDTKAEVVSRLLGGEALGVEGLVHSDGPVIVNLVGDTLGVGVSRGELQEVVKGSRLAEVVGTTHNNLDGGTGNTGGVLGPSEDSSVGVSELIVLNGASEAGFFLNQVSASEVLGGLVVVNNLSVLLGLNSVFVGASDSDVPLVVGDRKLGGSGPLVLLVDFSFSLYKKRISISFLKKKFVGRRQMLRL